MLSLTDVCLFPRLFSVLRLGRLRSNSAKPVSS